MDTLSKYGGGSSSVTSSYASRTTTTNSSSSSTTEDMPQWKRNMIERQKKDEEAQARTSSWYNSSTSSSTGGEEEDYITRRRRERAEQEKASNPSYRSRSVQPESSSSGYESTPEMRSYERYQQRKTSASSREEPQTSTKTVTFAQPTASTKPTPASTSPFSTTTTSYGGSYAASKNTPATTASSSAYGSSSTTTSSFGGSYSSSKSSSTANTPTTTASSYSSSYSSTPATTTPSYNSNTNKTSTPTSSLSSKEEATSSWKTSSSSTTSWKKPVAAPKEEEKPPAAAAAPVPETTPSWKSTPSWKKPAETKKEPSLGKISEAPAPAAPKPAEPKSTGPSWKKKVTVEVSDPPPAPKQDTPVPTTKPTPSWKKTAAATPTTTTTAANSSYNSSNTTSTSNSTSTSSSTMVTTKQDDAKVKSLETEVKTMKTEVKDLKDQVTTLKREKSNLQREKDEASKKPALTFESAKAAEASNELRKAKEKLHEYEGSFSKIEKEKNGLNLKVKELESMLEKKAMSSGNKKDNLETAAKLKFYENKLAALETENDKLHNTIQTLESEMEEVHDNFREDEADEYRGLKRDLETQSKNVRVLQFKLKKAERSISELAAEKADLETKVKSGGGSSYGSNDSSSKVRSLEKELEQKTVLVNKYEQQIADLRGGSKRGGGPVLSRTGSVERSVEDQLLKDLQDSIERENDLKEQLNMAEDEANEARKKFSRIEDENESLAQQVKKMAKGSKRSPSPSYGRGVIEKDEGISADGEELSASELKVQLEVSEGETGCLRKKVDNLLTENLKLSKEIREVNGKLTEEKKKKTSSSASSYGKNPGKEDKYYEQKVDDLQTELNTTRVKLIEKEREVERLDAQVKTSAKASNKGKLSRSGSQEEDLQKKITVIQQEANVFKDKVNKLEKENETLQSENKQLKAHSKKPASTQEKLQMDKFSLEEKVKKLETQLKDQTKKINDLQDAASLSKKDTSEIDRLKKEINNLEFDLNRAKSGGESDKRKVDKLERDLNVANDKAEKSQRELITAEREKRKSDEEKTKMETSVNKLEGDIRMLNREKDRLKEDCDRAKKANRDNLAQTEEGLKAFKDQIETLKTDLQDEKNKHRDTKRTSDEKIRGLQNEIREIKQTIDDRKKQCSDLEAKVADLDDKWAKSKRINKQKQDKIDSLEKDLDSSKANGSTSSAELSGLKSKLKEAEKNLDTKESKIKDLERDLSKKSSSTVGTGSSTLQTENDKLKKEIEDLKKNKPTSSVAANKEVKELKELIAKHENSEEQLVIAKARLTTDKEELEYNFNSLQHDFDQINGELSTLRQTYNNKADEWVKEKLDLKHRMKDLQDSLMSSAGEGWEVERDRFKQIIDDRDSQITQLKIEGDVGRSQLATSKKDCEELKLKLYDYEKMSKFQKAASSDGKEKELEGKLNEAKKALSKTEREHTSELNNVKIKYDGKVAVMSEEIASLKAQSSKYRREREHYKEMVDAAAKNRSGRTSGGDEVSEYKSKVSDLQYQIHALEDELAEAKLESSKASAQAMAQKSSLEIQIAELNSKMNEMEEENLIDSGRARIAGTRTKMELAWQKERESQKKLINELNTMSRDLKSTLLEVEKERDRERLEGRRKMQAMKGAYDEENDDTKKQITDLQYDLLELRDAHAKLRTTNEKLRRDKEKFERERDEFRYMAKERSRTEQGEEKKVGRLLKDMEDFLNACPQILGDGALKPTGDIAVPTRLDASAKSNFKNLLMKISDSRSELDAIHKMNEEERERVSARRAMMKRTGSVETEGGQDSPRGRTPGASGKHSTSSRFKKSVSIGDTIAESDQLWKSTDSRGSNESLASNASIPLPIPVRTRSAVGGSESGYSSDYNALSIRRLERDTSVDRLSTGSRESGMSTQSEWVAGEKKKKAGLIGKLKALTKNKDEKEFGSGSDISSVSMTSNMSAFAKAARKRSQSRDRGTSKDREKPKKPEEANQPFDKLFESSSKSGLGPSSAGASGSGGGTLPRTYRRF